MSRGDDFSFEIKEHLGILGTYSTGWKKESESNRMERQ